jgi:hypothetical protein
MSALSFEFFMPKDGNDIVLMAPCDCGLVQADTLRVDEQAIFAVRDRSILPIDLADIDDLVRMRLIAKSRSAIPTLTVAEFFAHGIARSYSLAIEVVN